MKNWNSPKLSKVSDLLKTRREVSAANKQDNFSNPIGILYFLALRKKLNKHIFKKQCLISYVIWLDLKNVLIFVYWKTRQNIEYENSYLQWCLFLSCSSRPSLCLSFSLSNWSSFSRGCSRKWSRGMWPFSLPLTSSRGSCSNRGQADSRQREHLLIPH